MVVWLTMALLGTAISSETAVGLRSCADGGYAAQFNKNPSAGLKALRMQPQVVEEAQLEDLNLKHRTISNSTAAH